MFGQHVTPGARLLPSFWGSAPSGLLPSWLAPLLPLCCFLTPRVSSGLCWNRGGSVLEPLLLSGLLPVGPTQQWLLLTILERLLQTVSPPSLHASYLTRPPARLPGVSGFTFPRRAPPFPSRLQAQPSTSQFRSAPAPCSPTTKLESFGITCDLSTYQGIMEARHPEHIPNSSGSHTSAAGTAWSKLP